MDCKMKFSMAIYKWHCETHDEYGDENGCLSGARECAEELRARVAELEAQIAVVNVLAGNAKEVSNVRN